MRALLATLAVCVTLSAFAETENKFAYITSLEFNNPAPITRCYVLPENGWLDECSDSGFHIEGLTRPGQISFLHDFAYVTTDQGPIVRCNVKHTTGKLSNCVEAGSVPNAHIAGIEFQKAKNDQIFAYLTDGNPNGQVWQCPVNLTTGLLDTCTANNQTFGDGLLFAQLEKFNDKKYLYFPEGSVGSHGQHVWKCLIDSENGDIQRKCVDSNAGGIFSGPTSIAFTSIDTNTYAYISNRNDNTVKKCNVSDTGNLGICTTLDQTFPSPTQIALPVINGKHYFYIGSLGNNDVEQCSINADGTLVDCFAVATDGSSLSPFGLTFTP